MIVTAPEESAKGKNTSNSIREEVFEIQTCSKATKNAQKKGNYKRNKRKDWTIIEAELNGENYDDAKTYLSEFCDSEFEVENKDNDGIWKDVNVNDLSGLDGRDVIGTETGKSKIDNTEKVEEQDYAETLVENDGAVQEGYESDEEHRLVDEEFQLFEGENIQVSDSDNACCDLESLNEFEGFESDGCEENAGNPNKVVKFRLEIDGENPQFQVVWCFQVEINWKNLLRVIEGL